AREKMVERQIAGRGISDQRILEAFRAVPREAFVPEHLHEFAYEDSPLPIEADQTISQPYIVALMAEAAELTGSDKLLEVGGGSGYAAAIFSRIVDEVIAIERHEELAQLAGKRMDQHGYENVSIYEGDGTRGFPQEGPFDAIIASASGSHVPDVLLQQLEVGGRLVMPVGEPQSVQQLLKITRTGEDEYEQEEFGAVRFVPLIGAHAWNEKGERSDPRMLPELIRDAAEPLRDEILARAGAAGLRVFSGSCSEVYLEEAFSDMERPDLPVARELGKTSLLVEVHPTLRPELIKARAERLAEIIGDVLG
ncbi:MAG: Protein-L-isoaspartate O-methyltransferase, partial [uncultured Sphingomonadaceae bacterium]